MMQTQERPGIHLHRLASKLDFNVLLMCLTDGVSYEVEDPRDSYDDVEASCEITHAEVHNVHGETPEIFTRCSDHDEDYLEPGMDG